MAGERNVTTNEAGEALVQRLNEIAVNCDSAIDNLLKLDYSFPPDIQSASTNEMDGNDLVKLVRNAYILVDNAVSDYKSQLGDYLIQKALPKDK